MSQVDISYMLKDVREQLKRVMQDLGLSNDFYVELMGSQFYGLAASTSDVDMAVALNELSPKTADVDMEDASVTLEREIQLRFAYRLVTQELVKEGTEPVHERGNCTLKWTSKSGKDASLLVTDRTGLENAMRASKVVKTFFSTHEYLRQPMRKMLLELREDGLLNPHGNDRKSGVGQHLKTVSAVLLVIGLLEDSNRMAELMHSGSRSDQENTIKMSFYELIAKFDADKHYFLFDLSAKSIKFERDPCRQGETPLILRVVNRNSASHLSYPQWAKIKHKCGLKSGHLVIPSLQRSSPTFATNSLFRMVFGRQIYPFTVFVT